MRKDQGVLGVCVLAGFLLGSASTGLAVVGSSISVATVVVDVGQTGASVAVSSTTSENLFLLDVEVLFDSGLCSQIVNQAVVKTGRVPAPFFATETNCPAQGRIRFTYFDLTATNPIPPGTGDIALWGFDVLGSAAASVFPLTVNVLAAQKEVGVAVPMTETDGQLTIQDPCGDGMPDAGEDCDLGVQNGTSTSCCTSDCSYRMAGEECRGAVDQCDAAETCTGSSAVCPSDVDKPDATVCTDDVFCNGTETCTAGTCGGSTGDPCPGPDGDADCTESCDEDGNDCAANDPDASACSDDLFCDGTEICSAGSCGNSSGDPCPGPDGDGDCSETCDEGANSCTANDTTGSVCDDGLFCSQTDTCNASGTCVGTGNPCPGPDGDGDCSETCDEGANNCTANDTGGSACDDGLFCTQTDTCNASGVCGGTGNPCPGPDADGDCSETCDESANDCTGNDVSGSACDDGLFCTQTDTCNVSGVCGGTGNPCPGPDGDGDCSETCDETANSCTANDTEGSTCTDGSFCNGTETCSGGACGSSTGDPCPGADGDGDCSESCNEAADNCTANDTSGSSCDDGLFCTQTDSCSASGTCMGTGNPCPGADGDSDCSESCNEGANDCSANDSNGSGCNDGLFCTQTDTCNASGACIGTSNPCAGADGDGDCSESCDEALSSCTANDPNGSVCNDGLFCTQTDSCDGSGSCVGAGDPCPGPDGDVDCSEGCDEASNNCTANDPDGSPCANDGNSCTSDACNALGVCSHGPTPDTDGDGICDADENDGLNGGDANNDGIADKDQGHVASIPSATGQGEITVEVSPGCAPIVDLDAFAEGDVGDDSGFAYPFGLVGFKLNCETADLKIIFQDTASLAGAVYRKFGPTSPGNAATAAFYTLPGAAFDAVEIPTGSGMLHARASFTLQDNVLGDDTGDDGMIVDQGGPARSAQRNAPLLGDLGLSLAAGLLTIVAIWSFARPSRRV